MAGAAVIVALTNALQHRDFPFVFGGDGASFAVSPSDATLARDALAATAAWVKEELDLTLRTGLVPVAAVRAHGADVRLARFAASDNIVLAMFSGGGLAWTDAAMKRGEFAVPPAPPGTRPAISGLSFRFDDIPASRGLILAGAPAPGAETSIARLRRSSPPSATDIGRCRTSLRPRAAGAISKPARRHAGSAAVAQRPSF